MQTATVEMVRDGAYVVIAIRPKQFRKGREWFYVPLPEEFLPFASEHCLASREHGVGIRLAKDNSGVDVAPMLVAADWLRDHDWTVEPLGWCKSEMERRQAV